MECIMGIFSHREGFFTTLGCVGAKFLCLEGSDRWSKCLNFLYSGHQEIDCCKSANWLVTIFEKLLKLVKSLMDLGDDFAFRINGYLIHALPQ